MIPEDEQYAKLRHQALFLSERGLTSLEMEDVNARWRTLVRLAGGGPGKLDHHLRERLLGELEQAVQSRLQETGLSGEWLESWDPRDEPLHGALPAFPSYPVFATSNPTSAERGDQGAPS